jgi:hypothetical protein
MKTQTWQTRSHYHTADKRNVGANGHPNPRSAAAQRLDKMTTTKLEAVRDLYRELREADRAIDLGAPEARFAAMASKSAGLIALKTLCESLPPDLRSRIWAVGSFSKG